MVVPFVDPAAKANFATTVQNDKSTEPDESFVERKVPYIEKKLGLHTDIVFCCVK